MLIAWTAIAAGILIGLLSALYSAAAVAVADITPFPTSVLVAAKMAALFLVLVGLVVLALRRSR